MTNEVFINYRTGDGEKIATLIEQAGRISGSTFHPSPPDDHADEPEDEAHGDVGTE